MMHSPQDGGGGAVCPSRPCLIRALQGRGTTSERDVFEYVIQFSRQMGQVVFLDILFAEGSTVASPWRGEGEAAAGVEHRSEGKEEGAVLTAVAGRGGRGKSRRPTTAVGRFLLAHVGEIRRMKDAARRYWVT